MGAGDGNHLFLMKTTLLYTVSKSNSVETLSTGMSGYRLDLAVTEVLNIDSNIFILQREVPVGNQETYQDTFYSVASVPQMASLPTGWSSMDQPFYRVSSISLVFRSVEEMERDLSFIEILIAKLVNANDLILAMLPPQKIALPQLALARFWGLSTDTTITDGQLQAAQWDPVYSNLSSVTVPNPDGARHIFFACRSDLGPINNLVVNGISQAFTLTTRAYTNPDGYTASYDIYVTNDALTGDSFAINTLYSTGT